jgi:methylmalonyl-CoA carboxyltransferase large subunit
MKPQTEDWTRISDALGALREEVARLSQRVAVLESRLQPAEAGTPTSPGAVLRPAPEAENLSEELIVVISAAIAAFLGKKPHIRQIRLLGAAAWAQQGRVTIQASHNLAVRHG